MSDAGAIRAGSAFVQMVADDSAIEPGLNRAEAAFRRMSGRVSDDQSRMSQSLQVSMDRAGRAIAVTMRNAAGDVTASITQAAGQSSSILSKVGGALQAAVATPQRAALTAFAGYQALNLALRSTASDATVATERIGRLDANLSKIRKYAGLAGIIGTLIGNQSLKSGANTARNIAFGGEIAQKFNSKGVLGAAAFTVSRAPELVLMNALNLAAAGVNRTVGLTRRGIGLMVSPLVGVAQAFGLVSTNAKAVEKQTANITRELAKVEKQQQRAAAGQAAGRAAGTGFFSGLGFGVGRLAVDGLSSLSGNLNASLQRAATSQQSAAGLQALVGKQEDAAKLMAGLKAMPLADSLDALEARGVPILETLETRFGKTAVEIKSMAATGQLSFADLQSAIVTTAQRVEGFTGTAGGQFDSLSSLMGRLRDAWSSAQEQMSSSLIAALRVDDIMASLLPLVNEIPSMSRAIQRQLNEIATTTVDLVSSAFGELVPASSNSLDSLITNVRNIMSGIPFYVRNATDLSQIALIDLAQSVMDLYPATEQSTQGIAVVVSATFSGLLASVKAVFSNVIGGFTELKNVAIAVFTAIGAGITAAFEGKNPFAAMKEKFIETFSKQQDAAPAKSAAQAFADAFVAEETRLQQTFEKKGLSDQLSDRRAELEKRIADREREVADAKAAQQQNVADIKAGSSKASGRVAKQAELARFEIGSQESVKLIAEALGSPSEREERERQNNRALKEMNERQKAAQIVKVQKV